MAVRKAQSAVPCGIRQEAPTFTPYIQRVSISADREVVKSGPRKFAGPEFRLLYGCRQIEGMIHSPAAAVVVVAGET